MKTPSQIGQPRSLNTRHPEYQSQTLSSVPIRSIACSLHTVDEWEIDDDVETDFLIVFI